VAQTNDCFDKEKKVQEEYCVICHDEFETGNLEEGK